MSSRDPKARHRIVIRPEVAEDLLELAEYGPDVVAAARTMLHGLARGSVTGKPLGDRNVSGDLTGLASVKFDVPGEHRRRFRLIYRDLGDGGRGVIAIGVRDEHAIYRIAASRFEGSGVPRRPPRES